MASSTKKPKAKKAVPGESKQDKFVRLAKDRGVKFSKYINLLTNLTKGYTYTIDPELAKQLLEKFDQEFTELRTSWTEALNKLDSKDEDSDESNVEVESEETVNS